LLENRPPLPICLVRISHPEWEFEIHRLGGDIEDAPRTKLRDDLRRSKVTGTGGFLAAHHDIEVDRCGDSFCLYFCGLAFGPKRQMLQNLRKLPGYDRNSIVYYPLAVNFRSLQAAAAALSSFWPQHTWGSFGHQLKRSNDEVTTSFYQRQALYLTWLDHKTLSNVFVFDDVCACDGKLQLRP
jgi:hypothetical protein